MGLFDQVAGMLGGGSGQAASYQAILSWVNEQGGVNAILEKLRQEGLTGIIESWLSTHDSLPISAEQITAALGSPAIASLAAKMGIDSQNASALIADNLPKIIDALSPKGQLDEHQDLVSAGMNLLKGKLFS